MASTVPTPRRRWGDEASGAASGVFGRGGGGGVASVEVHVGGVVSDGGSTPPPLGDEGGGGLVIVPHVGPLDFGDGDVDDDGGNDYYYGPTLPKEGPRAATVTDDCPTRSNGADPDPTEKSWTLVPAGPGFVPDFDAPASPLPVGGGDPGDFVVAGDEFVCRGNGEGDGIHAHRHEEEIGVGVGVGGSHLHLPPASAPVLLVAMSILTVLAVLGIAAATARDAFSSPRRGEKVWGSASASVSILRRLWMSWLGRWCWSSSSSPARTPSKKDGTSRRRRGRRRRKARSNNGDGGQVGRSPGDPRHVPEEGVDGGGDGREPITAGTTTEATSNRWASSTAKDTGMISETPAADGGEVKRPLGRGEVTEEETAAAATAFDMEVVHSDSDSVGESMDVDVDGIVDDVADTVPPPPSTPSRTAALVASASSTMSSTTPVVGFVAGTPVTARQYAMQVETVATAVSSTGLDRRKSLLLANETVLRRLESDFDAMRLGEVEARRDAREEARRAEDRAESERRHRETLGTMRTMVVGGPGGRPGSAPEEDEVEMALCDLRRVAFRVLLPGGHLVLCVVAAISSKVATRHGGDVLVRGCFSTAGCDLNAWSVMWALLDQACGCVEVASAGDGDAAPANFYDYSLLSYATPSIVASHLSWTLSPSSAWWSMTDAFASNWCRSTCAVTSFLMPVAILALVHRSLDLFHCGPRVHRTLNVAASVLVLVLPRVGWVMSAIVELAPPVVVSNASVAVATLAWVRRYRRRRSPREGERDVDGERDRDRGGRRRRRTLSRLRNVKLLILFSTCVWSTLIGVWMAMK